RVVNLALLDPRYAEHVNRVRVLRILGNDPAVDLLRLRELPGSLKLHRLFHRHDAPALRSHHARHIRRNADSMFRAKRGAFISGEFLRRSRRPERSDRSRGRSVASDLAIRAKS